MNAHHRCLQALYLSKCLPYRNGLCVSKLPHIQGLRTEVLKTWRQYCSASQSVCSTSSATSTTEVQLKKQWQQDATLYVHWPYCERRCTYCNFNKYISKSVNHVRMKECLVKETEYLIQLSQVSKIKSIFFGGGTPSLAEPDTIQSVIDTVKSNVDFLQNSEVTIEVNPTAMEAAKLSDFKGAGINRVSLGLQALDEETLQLFGRNHTVEEGLKCLEVCKSLFPGRTSIDVIFGRPGQNIGEWEEELQKISDLADDHISLYQLTLERGTAFFKMVMERKVLMPASDKMADLYEVAVEKLSENGFSRYEASNFSKSKSSESNHNRAYWTGSQFIGVGPGAHGRFTPFGDGITERQARIQTLEPDPWMFEVEKYGHATRKAESQTQMQVLEELLATGLRTTEGLTEQRWSEFSEDSTLQDLFYDKYMVRTMIKEGFLQLDSKGLRATSKGLNVVDSVISEIIHILHNSSEMES